MPPNPSNSGSTLIPCLRYRDAPRAIDWLCQVFGFERHLIVPGPNDTIAHAQLSNGRGMIQSGASALTTHGRNKPSERRSHVTSHAL